MAIMLCFIVVGAMRWLFYSAKGIGRTYQRYGDVLGKTLQVGLELLVAADIIRTVALDLILLNIGLLGALVVVRTAIGWTLSVEVEDHWPWQRGKESGPARQKAGRSERGIHG